VDQDEPEGLCSEAHPIRCLPAHKVTTAYLNRIATAVPDHDVHPAFVAFADSLLDQAPDRRAQPLFRRMASRSAISHRFSVLAPNEASTEFWVNAHEFYRRGAFPATSERMKIFETFAPVLARRALDRLALGPTQRAAISHVVITTCTGLYAPGLDVEVVDHLGLNPHVERTVIGFMGCYAAINGLKMARHIVRSEPDACVLMVNLELCTLHLQETFDLEQVLSFLVFADGCAASLISAEPVGFALDSFRALTIPQTRDLITWNVRGLGFDMLLSGQVPGSIAQALECCTDDILPPGRKEAVSLWGVHPGGKSVLDAVERGFALDASALDTSREVLRDYGNMSSATVMFVLEKLLASAKAGEQGCAMSFGPGLTAETMLFHAV